MADEEECECPECPKGLPAYLATFADLMSLLMCFFVLLLAFSEMDVQKYKQVAATERQFASHFKAKIKGEAYVNTPKTNADDSPQAWGGRQYSRDSVLLCPRTHSGI